MMKAHYKTFSSQADQQFTDCACIDDYFTFLNRVVIIGIVLCFATSCASRAPKSPANAKCKGKFHYGQNDVLTNPLYSCVGPLEFKSVNVASAIIVLRHNLEKNGISNSICYIQSGQEQDTNVVINLRIERCTLENALNLFCKEWGGRWELNNKDGPIIFRKSCSK